jgi:hypothetical protein
MGKQKREQKRRRREAERRLFGSEPTIELDEALDYVFGGKGQEEITDELILELVEKGIPEEDLRAFKDRGFAYCRERGSFVGSPEFMGGEL